MTDVFLQPNPIIYLCYPGPTQIHPQLILLAQVCPEGKAGSAPHVTSHKLDRPHTLHLSPPEALALDTHAQQTRSWGWSWQSPPPVPTQIPISPGSLTASHRGPISIHHSLSCNGMSAISSSRLESSPGTAAPWQPAQAEGAKSRLHDRINDNGDGEILDEAALLAPPSRPQDIHVRKRHCSQLEVSAHDTGPHQSSWSDQERSCRGASIAGARPSPDSTGSMCSAQGGAFLLTHLACIVGVRLNGTELQVGVTFTSYAGHPYFNGAFMASVL